jgi:hypothetical protein
MLTHKYMVVYYEWPFMTKNGYTVIKYLYIVNKNRDTSNKYRNCSFGIGILVVHAIVGFFIFFCNICVYVVVMFPFCLWTSLPNFPITTLDLYFKSQLHTDTPTVVKVDLNIFTEIPSKNICFILDQFHNANY